MDIAEKYKVPDVPEGESGDWKIKRFTVKENTSSFIEQITSIMSAGCYVPFGDYMGLYRRDKDGVYRIIMSDTPDEIHDHIQPIMNSKGSMLIVGLGLGVVLNAVAQNPEVNSITIIEKSADVLALVRDHYDRKYPGKITFIQDDIFMWKPPKDARYNYAWFDIWDELNVDNLSDMKRLHQRFTRRADRYGSWGQALLQRIARQERSYNPYGGLYGN